MDAVGVERAHLFGVSEGGALSIAFAAHYPHRVESLILYGSYPRKVATADYPWGVSRQTVAQFLDRFDDAWASGAWWDIVNPDLPPDPDTQRWWARYLRVGASPSMARDLMLMNAQIDVRSCCRKSTPRHWYCTAAMTVGSRSATAATSRATSSARSSSNCPALIIALGWKTPTPCSIRCRPPSAARSAPPPRQFFARRACAQPPRARDRPARRRRPVNAGHRPAPVPQRTHRRNTPAQRVHETRRQLQARTHPTSIRTRHLNRSEENSSGLGGGAGGHDGGEDRPKAALRPQRPSGHRRQKP